MQLEIGCLRRRLRREQQRMTPLDFDPSSDDDRDGSYRTKSLPSESFSYDEDRHYKQRSKSPSRKGLGNDAEQGF